MDSLIGGGASACAAVFSNPFDVVKTRMQLQGELKGAGEFKEVYKNVAHAFYLIAKTDGYLALQKGLIPAVAFHMIFNTIRLGLYHIAEDKSLTINEKGKPDVVNSIFFGSLSGMTGAFAASPFYLVKTQMQSNASESIAVGFQYHYTGTMEAFRAIYVKNGIKGLWQGWESVVPRVGFGSVVQLATFSREILKSKDILNDDNFKQTLLASNISALTLAVLMCPFDVIATRLYNQDGSNGRQTYRGLKDCALKLIKTEGLPALYKGVVPFFFRALPHSVLSLYFYDTFLELFHEYKNRL